MAAETNTSCVWRGGMWLTDRGAGHKLGEIVFQTNWCHTRCILTHFWLLEWHLVNLCQHHICKPDAKMQLHWQPQQWSPFECSLSRPITHRLATRAKLTRHVNSGFRLQTEQKRTFHTRDKSVQYKQPGEYGEHRRLSVCVLFMWRQKYRPHDLQPTGRVLRLFRRLLFT